MDENKKAPKIRFAGFTDVWEQRKLREVTERYDNLRIPVAANLRVPGTTPYYGANGIQDYVDGFTHDGEFVLIAEDGANDLKNYPVKYVKGRIWVNNHAHVLQAKENISDNSFLAYSLNQADIESLLVGGGRAKLNSEIMMGIDISMPTLEEQKRIGDYLCKIDNLIILHQRKYDKFVLMKKSMLEKMYPKNGSNVPEIRFAGFTDAWEHRKLEELSDFITKGATPTTYGFKWEEDGILFFRNDSIKDNRFVFGEYSYISEEANTTLFRSEICSGDILVAITGDIGKVGLVPESIEKANINQHMAKIRIIKDAYPYFVYQYLSTNEMQKKYQEIKTGLSMPQLSLEQIRVTNVILPSIEEQKKIGCYFQTFNNLITLHQRKVEKLKRIKKAMLEKMFV